MDMDDDLSINDVTEAEDSWLETATFSTDVDTEVKCLSEIWKVVSWEETSMIWEIEDVVSSCKWSLVVDAI